MTQTSPSETTTAQAAKNQPTSDQTHIIVGAGHAAGQLAASLRQEGFEGRIVMVGEEDHLPYQRPPLSKKYLSGEFGLDRVMFKPPAFYEDAKVETRLGVTAINLDTKSKTLALSDGTSLSYDKLALTTGSRVRKLPIPGADLKGIHYLRTVNDVDGMRDGFAAGKNLVIVGGGYIGLEVAAVATGLGLKVTVLEMEDRVLKRVTSPELSHFFEDVHRAAGVDIRCKTGIASFEGLGDRAGELGFAVTGDGEKIPADLALIGVGILPNVELASESGLKVENGISVDAFCQTSDPDIVSAGDCTEHPSAVYDRRIRLESVHNALEQAKTAAATLCGKQKVYDQVPWFWSDQYDLKLQIAGLNAGYDTVVLRGNIEGKKFALFYLKEGALIAVDAINSAPEYMMGRRLIAAHAVIPPERLKDTSISMKEMA
jgi:3-phenylpropionate/trans-cinnamate dioxygenase ferredoxin reductase component